MRAPCLSESMQGICLRLQASVGFGFLVSFGVYGQNPQNPAPVHA